jgi:NADPH-dependent F420 reductase
VVNASDDTSPVDNNRPRTVGLLGGTGPAGSGLAVRLGAAGYDVLLGSRDAARAATRVAELQQKWQGRLGSLQGVANHDATNADVIVLAAAADSVLPLATEHSAALVGHVVVSMANLLKRDSRGFAAVMPPEGSVALALQAVLDARVVGAFQNLPAAALVDLDHPLDADVLVCGDDKGAVQAVMHITDAIDGLHAVDAGPLVNTIAVEAMTAVLLTVNRARKHEHSVRIVNLRG